MISPHEITGLILAGGRGTRMGGIDKGLQAFRGLALVQHALNRLQRGGVSRCLINANRNLAAYAAFGTPVWPDEMADYAGPLAGFLTGLAHCETPYLLTVPCDTPLLPLDLANRLAQALAANRAEIAMAAAPEPCPDGRSPLRTQPVFCLLSVNLRDSLQRFTQDGGRKVDAWTAHHATVVVPFDQPQDDPHAFFNANTLAELQQLESKTA